MGVSLEDAFRVERVDSFGSNVSLKLPKWSRLNGFVVSVQVALWGGNKEGFTGCFVGQADLCSLSHSTCVLACRAPILPIRVHSARY
jgi:hypothetical protein